MAEVFEELKKLEGRKMSQKEFYYRVKECFGAFRMYGDVYTAKTQVTDVYVTYIDYTGLSGFYLKVEEKDNTIKVIMVWKW